MYCRGQEAGSSATSDYYTSNGITARDISRLSPVAIARGIDAYYADTSQPLLGGPNTDDSIETACGTAIGGLVQQAQTQAQTAADNRKTQLEDSVTSHTFQATNSVVHEYMVNESIGTSVRSISCSNELSCTVAFNDLDPGNHPILGLIFGQAASATETQLISPMTQLFKALFADDRMQSATITSWIDLKTPGGIIKKWPALRVACSRSADRQINWDNVDPSGLRQLCDYQLLPAGSP